MHLARLLLCLAFARHSRHASPQKLSVGPMNADVQSHDEVPMLPPPQNDTEGRTLGII